MSDFWEDLRNKNSEGNSDHETSVNRTAGEEAAENKTARLEAGDPEKTAEETSGSRTEAVKAEQNEPDAAAAKAESSGNKIFESASAGSTENGTTLGASANGTSGRETTMSEAVRKAAGVGNVSGKSQDSDRSESGKKYSSTYSWVNPKLREGGSRQESSGHVNYRDDISAGSGASANSGYQSRSARTSYGESSGSTESRQNTGTGNTAYPNGNGSSSGQRQAGTDSGRGYSYDSRMNRSARRGSGNGKRPKQKKTGRKWASVVAMALVFGLVGGSVFYGTYRAENKLLGSGDSQESATIESAGTLKSTNSNSTTGSTTSSSTNESDQEGTVASVAKNAMPAMVTISTMSVQEMQNFFGGTQQYEVEGAGTGVIVGQNDTELLIATNNHVISGAKELSVGFIDNTAVSANIKGTDSENDLAVIAVKLSDISDDTKSQIKTITLGDSDSMELGDQVVAIGNALGYGQSVTSGYISAFDRELQLSDGTNTFTSSGLIQTDAAINAGNSGGALLNMKGELIGINEAKSSSSGSSSEASVDNVGYSIPISKAEPILEKLMNQTTKEKVDEDKQGYLGITTADVTSESSEMYQIPQGVYIRQVADGGPADEAGAKVGDVITEINGTSVSSYEDLKEALSYTKSGETVSMVVERGTEGTYKEVTLKVTLGSKDAISSLQNSSDSNNSQNGSQGSDDSDSSQDSQNSDSSQDSQNSDNSQDSIFGNLGE